MRSKVLLFWHLVPCLTLNLTLRELNNAMHVCIFISLQGQNESWNASLIAVEKNMGNYRNDLVGGSACLCDRRLTGGGSGTNTPART